MFHATSAEPFTNIFFATSTSFLGGFDYFRDWYRQSQGDFFPSVDFLWEFSANNLIKYLRIFGLHSEIIRLQIVATSWEKIKFETCVGLIMQTTQTSYKLSHYLGLTQAQWITNCIIMTLVELVNAATNHVGITVYIFFLTNPCAPERSAENINLRYLSVCRKKSHGEWLCCWTMIGFKCINLGGKYQLLIISKSQYFSLSSLPVFTQKFKS